MSGLALQWRRDYQNGRRSHPRHGGAAACSRRKKSMSPKNSHRKMLQLGEKSHYHFLLAEKGGTLAGYTCFGRIPLTAERYDLYWIVT